MWARTILFGFGLLFAAPFGYGLLNLPRTLAAPAPLSLALLVIFPCASIVALGIGLRGSPRARTYGATALTVLVLAICAAEAALPRLENRVALRELEALGEPDRRTKPEVLADAQAAGRRAVTFVEPKGLLRAAADGTLRSSLRDGESELLPLGGVSHRHTVVCNETGQWITYESDRHGMNNPDQVWDLPRAKVAVVGDAFANGWCAPSDQHFVAGLVEERTDLVNVAQSGNGPLLTLASVLEYLPGRRPETVVWFHYELNDFQDLSIERRSPLLVRYMEGGGHQELTERQGVIDEALEGFLADEPERWADAGRLLVEPMGWVPGRGAVVDFLKLTHVRARLGAAFHVPFPADHALWLEVIARAKQAVEGWGGSLQVVFLPAAPRYQSGPERRTAEGRVERMRADLEALGVPLVDGDDAFRRVTNDPLRFFHRINGGYFGHYTAEGHALIGEAVRTALVEAEAPR